MNIQSFNMKQYATFSFCIVLYLFTSTLSYSQSIDTTRMIAILDTLNAELLGNNSPEELKNIQEKILNYENTVFNNAQETFHFGRLQAILTDVYAERRLYTQALESSKKAVAIYQKHGFTCEVRFLKVGYTLGRCYVKCGKPIEGIEHIKSLMECPIPDSSSEAHKSYFSMVNLIGICNYQLGNFEKAEDYFRQYAEYCKEFEGAESGNYVSAIYNIANVNTVQGKHETAMEYLEKCLSITENNEAVPREYYLGILNNMANSYMYLGDLIKSEQMLLKVLSFLEGNELKYPEIYATNIGSLGLISKASGNLKKSLKYYIKRQELIEEIYGVKSLNYFDNLNRIAGLYSNLNKDEDAENIYLEFIDYYKKNKTETLSDLYLSTLKDLSSLYLKGLKSGIVLNYVYTKLRDNCLFVYFIRGSVL